jgi:hypothetical protein
MTFIQALIFWLVGFAIKGFCDAANSNTFKPALIGLGCLVVALILGAGWIRIG